MELLDEDLLVKLSEIDSAPGSEKNISLALRKEYEKLSDEIVYDNLGSIFAVKKSKSENAPHVMVVGHMDELGFIVKKINDNGTMKALALGNVEANSLMGAEVRLRTRDDNSMIGTILPYNKDGKVLNDSKEVIVDFGFSSEEDVKNNNINLGDRISFTNEVAVSINGQRIQSKNWDGRYAPLLGIELLRAVKDMNFDFDLYVGCTVQEQVGYRGIQTATNLVKPDLGIVLDTDKAFDYQEDNKEVNGQLGKGLLVNFYDTGVLPNRLLISTLRTLCKDNNISYQHYYSMEGSDAAWINKLGTGSPTLFVNIPVRNMNTPTSVIDVNDYAAAKNALQIFLKNLTPEKIKDFKEENR